MRRSRLARMIIAVIVLMGSFGSLGVARVQAANPPSFGVRFMPSPGADAGQCWYWNPNPMWATAATPSSSAGEGWTPDIVVDTDGRVGGCNLAFGMTDYDNSLQSFWIFVSWAPPDSGTDAGQCGGIGTYMIPLNGSLTSNLGLDMDNRAGWCNLTFSLYGRSDIELDIQFWGDGGQCFGAIPYGSWYSLRAGSGSSITLGLNTDSRPGGCGLKFRLRLL